MSISELYAQIAEYYSLKSNLSVVVGYLNNSSANLSPIPSSIYEVYSIDDNRTPIVDRATTLYNDIVGTSGFITGAVFSAIDEAIVRLRAEIARLEAEMRRREEEERKAATAGKR